MIDFNKAYLIAEKTHLALKTAIVENREEFDFTDENLTYACALASELLKDNLRDAGIPSSVVVGGYRSGALTQNIHCWCEVGDGYILDITAKQFDPRNNDITFIDKDDPLAKNYKKNECKSISEWNEKQYPTEKRKNLISAYYEQNNFAMPCPKIDSPSKEKSRLKSASKFQ